MSKNKFFFKVPKTVDDTTWKAIVLAIPLPEIVDGMKWIDRKILETSVPNKKNKRGETQNLARQAGTGKRDETLLGSFERGIDVREMPPKLINEEGHLSLYGGYGRSVIFEELQYKVWVYDIYEYDESTRNELQTNNLEVLEDAAISDNGSAKSKPAEKSDYVGLLVKRIQDHQWDRNQMQLWFDSIEHCLTKRQVVEYITAAIRKESAIGRIEWYKEHEINQIVKNFDPNMTILNTTDCENGNTQRFIRTSMSMMRSYINSKGVTQEYCLWNSQAVSHQEIDDANVAAESIMNNFVDTCVDFVSAMAKYQTKPCVPSKVVYQKIGGQSLVGEIVDYPALDF